MDPRSRSSHRLGAVAVGRKGYRQDTLGGRGGGGTATAGEAVVTACGTRGGVIARDLRA